MMVTRKMFNRTLIIILFVFGCLGNLFSQGAATLSGVVTDKNEGTSLPGANVFIEDLSLGAITDLNGKYSILRIPPGTYTLQVSFIGYATQEITQQFEAGGNVVLDIALEYESLGLAEVVVTVQRRGQLAAINQQLSADQMKNVVSGDRIQEVPDANAAESISRLPGISLQRSSGEGNGVIIRGLAPKFNAIQINGISMASTGFVGGESTISVSQDRGSDLSGISSENLGGIEVFKAITPDMDAGSIGGVVNLMLARAKQEPEYMARLYGAYNAMQKDFGQYKGFAKVSRRFFKNTLGVQASFNAERRNRGRDRLTATYFGKDTGNENEKEWQISEAAIEDRQEIRKRLGGSLILDWETDKHALLFSNFISTTSQEIQYRKHHYVDGDETYVIPGLRDQNLNVMSNALNGKHSFTGIKIDWNLVHSFSQTKAPFQHEMRFYEQAGLGEANRLMNPEEFLALLPVDSTSTVLRVAQSDQLEMQERRLVADLNFTIPLTFGDRLSGMIKLGGKYTKINRKSDQNTGLLVAVGIPDDPLLDVKNWIDPNYDPGKVLNGLTTLGLILDPTHGYTIYDRLGEYYNVSPFHGSNNDYEGIENTYAGYLMVKLNFSQWVTVIPGVRYEQDDNNYQGFNRFTTNSWATPGGELFATSGDFKNDYWFPMFHIKIKPLNWMDVRFAYTNTLARPNFYWRIPYFNRSSGSPNWSGGIPTLKPAVSENFDVYLSVYESKFGLFTVGWFHKNIDNISYSVDWQITEGEEEAARLGLNRNVYQLDEDFDFTHGLGTIPLNLTETSTVNGVEFDLQTNFFFLPGLLKNFVFNANFTYIISESQLFSSEQVLDPVTWVPSTVTGLRSGKMPQQPDYIVNLVLGYDIGGFSGRISMFSQGRTLDGVGKLAPCDRYVDPFTRFDVSLKYAVNHHLSFLFNGTNLFNEPDTQFQSDTPKYRLLEYYGSMYDFGVQWTF
jgi:TonB-dependent receptor